MLEKSRFRERVALLVYALSAAGILAMYLLLGTLRNGLPAASSPNPQVELAVLVPLSGQHAQAGQAVLAVVQQAAKARPVNLKLNPPSVAAIQTAYKTLKARQAHLRASELDVVVVGYDTAGTPEGAARAAARAALKPATAAIIGPLDARQVVAAAEALQGSQLAIITPASTAPLLRLERYPGLYRIPATDTLQGQAMVDFLAGKLHQTDVFLIVESSPYARGVLDSFVQAAGDRLRLVERLDVDQSPLPADLAQRIAASRATAIVYIGGLGNAQAILHALNAAGLALPLVGSDALNDPGLLPPAGMPIYYTSPILSMPAASTRLALGDDRLATYRQALGQLDTFPFAYEAVQATWLVLDALENQPPHLARQAVWRNLAQASIPGLEADITFSNGQRLPRTCYVYELSPEASDWSHNPLLYFIQEQGP